MLLAILLAKTQTAVWNSMFTSITGKKMILEDLHIRQIHPVSIYLFKFNKGIVKKTVCNLFKVSNKDIRMTSCFSVFRLNTDIYRVNLVFLLLTLNK